jgi:ArsR family metal-binding transcriptional regulator
MLKRLKENFDRGIEKIKWISTVLSERIKIELLVMKLLFQSEKMEKKRDELLKKIGQRVYELKGDSDRNVLKDRSITEALNEIEQINSEIDSTKKKASEISGSL